MTRDDIIRMAREQGLPETATEGVFIVNTDDLGRMLAAEREACAELVWPTTQVKVWSDPELEAMTGAFNRAQEKHGWYETIMAVGAAALKSKAADIRARGEQK